MSFTGQSLQRTWHLVDATKQTVGRIANIVAPLLKGKHKPTYRPNGDCGDYVVIINAEKVSFDLLIRTWLSKMHIYTNIYNYPPLNLVQWKESYIVFISFICLDGILRQLWILLGGNVIIPDIFR